MIHTVILMTLVGSSLAMADLNTFSSRPGFEAEGTVVYNYGFEDHGSDFTSLPEPYYRDGVTYTTADNLVVGPVTSYSPLSNVFVYDGWTPLTASIDPGYDMFGFDLGVIGTTRTIGLTVYTNVGSYSYPGLAVPNGNAGMDFFGFTAGAGEFFTGISLTGTSSTAPAIDNVTLGHTVVPVPGAFLLGSMGLGFATWRLKRRKMA